MAAAPSYPTRAAPPVAGVAVTRLVTAHLLRGGARVAWRLAAPATAGACAVAVFLGPGFIDSVARVLLPPAAGVGLGPAIVALLFLLLAGGLHARLRAGGALLRSLPIGTARIHRARILAAALAQAPVALALAVLFLATLGGAEGLGPSASGAGRRDLAATVLGLVIAPVGAAVATASLSARFAVLAPLALGGTAALCAVAGDRRLVVFGAVLVAAGLWLPVRAPTRPPPRDHARRGPGIAGSLVPLPWLRSCRALGFRGGARTFAAPLLCVAAAAAFTGNNELPAPVTAAAWRLGAAAGVALVLGGFAHGLQSRRSPWAWSRSLPWSSRHRVLADAGLLALPAATVLLLVAAAAPRPVVPAAALLPYLAVRAAGVARTREERLAGSAALVFTVEGCVLAGAGALVWWAPFLTLPLVPFALRNATATERAARVSKASELHASDRGAQPA
jgi:hypothetical protein